MQVLEMKEVESLVGNANRKRLGLINGLSRKKKSGNVDVVPACANRSDLLSKLVVVACITLLGLLYMSARSDGDTAGINTKGFEIKHPMPEVPSPFSTPPPVDVFTIDKKEQPTQPKPVPVPVPVPVEKATLPHTPVFVEGDNDPYIYSKYAAILPLIDHPLPDEEKKAALNEKFGKWHFWDGDEDERPMEDYTGKFPNRDIPGEDIPDEAWQADAVYVNHILNDADQLIARTMEAIFIEYGHGKPLEPAGLAERMKMFHWSREDLSRNNAKAPEKYLKRGNRGNGGWTTKRSFDGLVRRLLHAMMTQDTFTVVMGGHSAAKGDGNHFRQSYMMQFHKVMYPIFARLGVKLITRNVGQGGLGTIQAGMGSGSIYGDEVDVLMWDSGMTERKPEHVDVFYRQALLAGNRIPVIWGGPFELLKMLHEEADVDVGDWGTAMDGIAEVESLEQAKELPWAARFLKCKPEVAGLCKREPRYCAKCWIDRKDNISPETKQRDKPRGQVSWHPGWRVHQLMGRNLAFALLEALQAAVDRWSEGVMGGPPLADDFWHVTEYYKNIRNKVKNLDKSFGSCYKFDGTLPTRLCNIPMKARTQYTPRANFHETALTSIIKPTPDGYTPKNERVELYEGPDEHNTCFDIPEGEIDVYNVVTGRRRLNEEDFQLQSLHDMSKINGDSSSATTAALKRNLEGDIIPGKGWEVRGEPPGLCDGTYNNTCGRWTKNKCAMLGHHDGRGAVVGNEYSGWLVMTLKDLKEGVIILKLHTRSYNTPKLPDGFAFDYAIDGVVTTLTKDQFMDKKKQIQRVVETLTILDDPNFTSESKDVEIAIRLRDSGRSIVFGVSHVYWA